MELYKYEYVNVRSSGFIGRAFKGYREIIDRYALDGWRFVAAVPVELGGEGLIFTLELVFEKEVSE